MLKINKVSIIINTDDKKFQSLYEFKEGLNIIYSRQNSIGKSSILSSIFYALGMEQLFNAKKNAQSLPFAFNEKIRDSSGESYSVKESEIFLEISNGQKNITINRTIVSNKAQPSLILVYEGNMQEIEKLDPEYYYVHYPNSTSRNKGFHKYLEKFLNLELPQVISKDNKPTKLYLQYLFATSFVSQKGGWNDYLGNTPYLGVKNPKKRVVEFLLDIKNDFLKQKQNNINKEMNKIKNAWLLLHEEITAGLKMHNLNIVNLDSKINNFNPDAEITVSFIEGSKTFALLERIELLTSQIQDLESTSLKIKSTEYKELEKQYNQLIDKEAELTEQLNNIKTETLLLAENLKENEKSLVIIESDISNNNDIKILKSLSLENLEISSIASGHCPTCDQKIEDSISINYIDSKTEMMSVEENITHLKAQKNLLEFTINAGKSELKERSIQTKKYEDKLRKLRDLIRYLKKDLFLIENQISYSVTKKIILLETEIESLKVLLSSLPEIKEQFINLYNEWKLLHKKFEELESRVVQDIKSIEEKITKFSSYFNKYFKKFGQQSLDRKTYCSISKETLLPTIHGVDLKSNLSASDMVRSVWAYIISLFEISKVYSTNHLDLIVMDEPGQHSIIEKDLRNLLSGLSDNTTTTPKQSIIALTAEKTEFISFIKHSDLKANVIEISTNSICEI